MSQQASVKTHPKTTPTNLADQRRRNASKSFWRTSLERFLKDRVSMVALVVFLLLGIAIVLAPLTSSIFFQGHTPDKFNIGDKFKEPSAKFVLGTDAFGRDVAVRLLYGGQISLAIGFSVAAVALTIGVLLGLLGGFFGGIVDDAINAIVNILQTIPTLFFFIILSVILLPEWWSLALILGVVGWTGVTRQVRGLVMGARSLDYVDAARVMGASNWRIMVTHILPNVMSIVLVVAGFEIAGAILSEAALSFLGFGVRPPTASWGNLLSNALDIYTIAPLQVIMPGVMISITVLCIFLIADGLRDAFDPRLKDKA